MKEVIGEMKEINDISEFPRQSEEVFETEELMEIRAQEYLQKQAQEAKDRDEALLQE